MSFVLIYIFISLLVVLAILLSLIKFWNPDISKFFKNEKIKTFLFDRYWLNKHKKFIKQKNLFLVIGSKVNNIVKELGEHQNIESPFKIFEGSKIPFEVIEVQSAQYLFLNEALLQENKEIAENYLARAQKNISRIIKIRKDLLLDGVIFFPNQSAFNKNNIQTKDLSEEAQIFTKIFKGIYRKLKSQIPIFFIEKSSFVNTPPFNTIPSTEGIKEYPVFGFSHKTLENTEELNKEIKKAIENSVYSYETQMQYYLQNLEPVAHAKVIQFFYNLKSGIIAFSKNYCDYFYKGFNLKNKQNTNFHYILNLSSFHYYNENDYNETPAILNMFNHISNHMANGSSVSKEFIRNKIRKSIAVSVFTVANVIFVACAIYSSSVFLRDKRGIFLTSFSELNNFIIGYKKIKHSPDNLNILQDKICSLISNSNKLALTSFYYPMLYPSWNNTLDKELTNKYNINLANFVSKILIQNFNEKVSNHLTINKINSEDTSNFDSILSKTIAFVSENKKIDSIYYLINSNEQVKNVDGLAQMANYLYGIDCGKTLTERKVFSTLNAKNVALLVNPNYSNFKAQSLEILNNLMQSYFQSFAENNEIIFAAHKVESDLSSIKELSESENQLQDIPFAEKLVQDINSLQSILLKDQPTLQNVNSFYGLGFTGIIKEVEGSFVFGKEVSQNILLQANSHFGQFKSKMNSIIPLGASFPIIINNSGVFTVNPSLTQLSSALEKMDEAYNKNNPNQNNPNQLVLENKQFSSDLKFISMNLPENALWDIDQLQSNLQKSSTFSTAFSSVNQGQYPIELTKFFKRFANSMSYIFWSKKLPASLKIYDINSQNLEIANQQIDPFVQNIQLSVPILKSISEQLINYSQAEINTNLSHVIALQINRQLKKYSNILNSSSYFTPIYPDFLWWDGETSPAYKAFGVSSTEDLKLYIANQKIAIEKFFNQNIQPILQSRSLYFKDATLLQNNKALENLTLLQDSLSPSPKVNSFAALSGFITTSMEPLRIDSCPKFISQPPSFFGNRDFFSIKQSNIYSLLASRCQSLLIKQAYSNYDRFAENFNAALAGKFPFQNGSSVTDTASLEDINAIFSDFALLQKQDLPILQKYSVLYRNRSDIHNFIKRMSETQKFFSPQNDKDGNPIPNKWNAELDFRTNTDKEILANQIINWSLQSGNEVIGSEQGSGSKAKFTWNYSDPIQFSVTLAQTSKYSLDRFTDDKNIFITNNTIYFNIRNRWSLLKLILDYADCGNSNFCLNNNLKFELPINNDKIVKFYVSIYLKNPKGVRVYVPKFPTSAPYLGKKSPSKISDNLY